MYAGISAEVAPCVLSQFFTEFIVWFQQRMSFDFGRYLAIAWNKITLNNNTLTRKGGKMGSIKRVVRTQYL